MINLGQRSTAFVVPFFEAADFIDCPFPFFPNYSILDEIDFSFCFKADLRFAKYTLFRFERR